MMEQSAVISPRGWPGAGEGTAIRFQFSNSIQIEERQEHPPHSRSSCASGGKKRHPVRMQPVPFSSFEMGRKWLLPPRDSTLDNLLLQLEWHQGNTATVARGK